MAAVSVDRNEVLSGVEGAVGISIRIGGVRQYSASTLLLEQRVKRTAGVVGAAGSLVVDGGGGGRGG